MGGWLCTRLAARPHQRPISVSYGGSTRPHMECPSPGPSLAASLVRSISCTVLGKHSHVSHMAELPVGKRLALHVQPARFNSSLLLYSAGLKCVGGTHDGVRCLPKPSMAVQFVSPDTSEEEFKVLNSAEFQLSPSAGAWQANSPAISYPQLQCQSQTLSHEDFPCTTGP